MTQEISILIDEFRSMGRQIIDKPNNFFIQAAKSVAALNARAEQAESVLAVEQAERKRVEAEEINRIRYLNKLATWAQQDPTMPIPAPVQEWVLEQIKGAFGQTPMEVGWVPDIIYLKEELLNTKNRLTNAHNVTECYKADYHRMEQRYSDVLLECTRLRESLRLADELADTHPANNVVDFITARARYLASRTPPAAEEKEEGE